jgi:hypothetical protein
VPENRAVEANTTADDPFNQHSRFGEMVRKAFGRTEEVSLSDIEKRLGKLQEQIDCVLEAVSTRDVQGMRLTEVSVGLAVTGEGSIGVATIGAEASITLTYARQ